MTRLFSAKSGPTNLRSPSALMILRIKGNVAAYEVEVMTDRVKDRMRS